MANIVVFGTGDIAQLAHYYFSKDSDHTVAAFTVNREYAKNSTFIDLPVVAFENVENQYPPDRYRMFIAVSYARVNKVRAEKYYQAREKGYELASYVSSKACVFDTVAIGDNCFILEDNTLQPFAKIGNNVTLWSGNHIGHHSTIGDHCFISSHVVVSGGVVIEPYCFIGVNATLRDHITIARETVIGAACLMLKNTKEGEVYVGTAAEPRSITSDRLKRI